jgi:hypothetical protein
MSLSPVESGYQAIQSVTPSTPPLGELSPDPFRVIFPTYEMIMSVMEDTPCDDGHHHSILFLEQHTLENYKRISTRSTVVVISTVPESAHDVFFEGNLSNISPIIPIDMPSNLGLSKMSILELRVLLTKSSPTHPYSNNFVTSLPGATKKFRVSTLRL